MSIQERGSHEDLTSLWLMNQPSHGHEPHPLIVLPNSTNGGHECGYEGS